MSLTLGGYRAQVGAQRCGWCKRHLPKRISHYEHPGGWEVIGVRGRQWLYIECVNPECRYQWALWKLGVDREAPVVSAGG